MKLLITTGATVTFKKLIRFIISDEFIQAIPDLKVHHLFIQYGNEITAINGKQHHISWEFINACFNDTEIFKSFRLDELSGQFIHDTTGLIIDFLPFTANLGEFIQQCDLTITHGGTGTIIDILKLHKPLVIVYNDELMGNHQAEIAHEFKQLGYTTDVSSSNLSIASIMALCKPLLNGDIKLKPFTSTNTSVMSHIVYNEINRVS